MQLRRPPKPGGRSGHWSSGLQPQAASEGLGAPAPAKALVTPNSITYYDQCTRPSPHPP